MPQNIGISEFGEWFQAVREAENSASRGQFDPPAHSGTLPDKPKVTANIF
jgi:hypothetical protein